MKKTKIGLVLEGGGMRGMYTAGVLDELMLRDIKADGVIGVSAGSIAACSYISGQVGRTIRYNLKYIRDKRYCSLKSLIKTGDLFNEQFCYHEIPDKLSPINYKTFRDNCKDMSFYITCTDLDDGSAYYHPCADIFADMDYLRASASLPLVSNIVEIDGKHLLDGGTADSIPVKFMESIGYDKNIIVLTRPEGYVKKPDSMIKFLEKKYKDYPLYVEACRNRYKVYNDTIDYIEKAEIEGRCLVIRPSRETKIKRLDKNIDRLKKVYKLGRFDTINMMDQIEAFINE